jgi:asparagine N-glycosylation enzyme membrane subunit Stt3
MKTIESQKAFIGYIKIFFSFILASTIGILAWIFQNFYNIEQWQLNISIAILILLTIILIALHIFIIKHIRKLEKLSWNGENI